MRGAAIIRSRQALALFAGPVALGLGYYAASAFSLHVTRGMNGIATIWPSSGLLLAALLLAHPRRHVFYVAAAAIASVLANFQFGTGLWLSIGFTVANMTEALLARWLLNRGGAPDLSFVDPAGIGHFCLAVFAGSAWSATLATLFAGTGADFLLSWFTTVMLGILTVTPMILTAVELIVSRRTALGTPRSAVEAAVIIGLVTTVTMAVFSQSSYPILFVPLVALLAATYRLGPFGAAGSVLIIALIASTMTTLGNGPMVLVHGGRRAVMLFLQFYILVLLASALPLAALLATRDRLLRRLGESKRLLELAEQTAQVGHWRLDLTLKTVFWSDEVFRIHGLPPGRAPTFDGAIEAYHPDDRERVSQIVQGAAQTLSAFEFEARIVRPDGGIRIVLSRGQLDLDEHGVPVAIFGMFQDVTRQVESAHLLAEARRAAEDAASRATLAAETDELTGIASRRKALRLFGEALDAARGSGLPLSIAIFDIDHFKAINDGYGHATGDQVLKRVTQNAGTALRASDSLGRLGGEEFLLLLPGADTAAAMQIAERVRASIEAGGSAHPRVTASVGVASFAPDATAETMLHRADCALYDAKRSGRNALRFAA